MDTDKSDRSKEVELRFHRVFSLVLLFMAVVMCAALIVVVIKDNGHECLKMTSANKLPSSKLQCNKTSELKSTVVAAERCLEGEKVTHADPKCPGIFQELGETELIAVRNFLMSKPELNLESETDATEVRINYIVYIDLMVPNKSDILAFWDSGAGKPMRQARVTLAMGRKNPPVIEEYVVGNLPSLGWYRLYENPSNAIKTIPFNRRHITTLEISLIYEVYIHKIEDVLKPLLNESYGTYFNDCDDKCLFIDYHYMDTSYGDLRYTWLYVQYDVPGYLLHYAGIYFLYNTTSFDKSEWSIGNVYYNGEYYTNIAHLRSEYDKGTLKVIKYPFPEGDPIFSDMKRHGSDDEYSDRKPGPRLVEPEGRRYKVSGRHVEYRGWSFDVSVDVFHGPKIYDVKFRSERIAYEISLQETCVFYGGNNPVSWNSIYYDTSQLLGASLSRLARGVDCPETAIYMDYTVYTTVMKTIPRAVCVFEQNGGIPLRRHYDDDYEGGYNFYGGLVDYYLVVRSIGTYYNYDYVFDFIFRNNGAVEVKVSTTGYVQVSFGTDKEKRYGNLLRQFALANVHQHLISLKVDLDLIGSKNRFATYDFGTETISIPHFSTSQKQISFNITQLTSEKNAALRYNFEKPKYYVVYNNDATNVNGYKRAYRIHNSAMTPMLLPNSSKTYAASWAKYQIAVTVHHDTEKSSSHPFNSINSVDPIVNFQSYIDNDENIVDEDLVLWVTMGTYHLPGAEDAPVTSTTGNQFSVFLKPFNFFDECPSSMSRDSLYIDPYSDKVIEETNGIGRNLTCVPNEIQFGMDIA